MLTKKSTYRQSGWKEVATGIIWEFYGTDVPPQDGTFVVVWDNQVTETVVTESNLVGGKEPVKEA